MDLGMAARAERDHQVQNRLAGHPMMNGDRALFSARRSADPAAVSVPFQDRFPETAEILFILSLEGVAGGTDTMGEDLGPAARTT